VAVPEATAAPRPSASVVLARDLDGGGVEVYVLTRPLSSVFAPGATVFPGGALDQEDGLEAALALAPGFVPDEAARRMGLAGDPESLRLRLHPQALTYIAHFLTPEGWPRRFDTRFFLAAAPAGQEARAHPAEAVDGGWAAPSAVLDRHRHGEVSLLMPTLLLLRDLAEQASVRCAIDALGSRTVRCLSI